MGLLLYMDYHVPRAVTLGLRLRSVDVITAFEDSANEMSDPELLNRASELNRVMFSQDDDMLVEVAHRKNTGVSFSGLIYGHQLRVSIGQCVKDLEILAKLAQPEELLNQVVYLPL